VIFSNIETISNIRQIAYTEIAAGFEVEQHCHDTMEEFFIIVEGSCEFLLDGNKFLCSKDSIIRVAPKTIHSIKAITCSKVFYFGVAI
jgi:quercetin dioxygenase-like cupin family protein